MFEKLSSIKFLYNSFLVAYKGRNKTKEVIEYKQNLEENLLNLRKNIINFTYQHKKYKTFIIKDSKKRVINAPSFEDHILHHSIFFLLEKVFEKKFINNSFANRKGKGSHKSILTLEDQSKKYDWYLKMDITKYFYTIDQEILFKQIKRHISDKIFLFFVKIIIDSYLEKNIINPLTENKTGMPIGNVTSQLFANIYLHDLDFYVENKIKPLIRKSKRDIFYIRYVDDFIFLARNKEDLILIKKLILFFLKNKLKLSVSKKKLILNKTKNGISFLGYIILKNRLKIKNDTIRRFKRKIRNYSNENKLNSLISFKGHCDLSNTKLIKSLTNSQLILSSNEKYKNQKLLNIIYDSGSRKQEKWLDQFYPFLALSLIV